MSDWFERLSSMLMGEPQDQKQLVDILRDAESRHLLNSELLTMIEGVLHVKEMKVRDIMVPRQQMVMLDDQQSLDDIMTLILESGHSRFPVLNHDNADEVLGLLHSKDLLSLLYQNQPLSIKSLLREISVVPETKPLDMLLKEFREEHKHMAIAVDEYGRIVGLVTMEDVLEQIVGDIEDEHDPEEEQEDIVKQGEALFIVNAHTSLDDFNDYFETSFEHDEFNTVGGIVLHEFGRMPIRGEEVTVNGLRFKVLNCDKRRLYQLELKK